MAPLSAESGKPTTYLQLHPSIGSHGADNVTILCFTSLSSVALSLSPAHDDPTGIALPYLAIANGPWGGIKFEALTARYFKIVVGKRQPVSSSQLAGDTFHTGSANMGKKSHSKDERGKQSNVSKSGLQTTGVNKLPPHKRNELNQLLDKILKGMWKCHQRCCYWCLWRVLTLF